MRQWLSGGGKVARSKMVVMLEACSKLVRANRLVVNYTE